MGKCPAEDTDIFKIKKSLHYRITNEDSTTVLYNCATVSDLSLSMATVDVEE
jgi:hypothetical protein